MITSYHNRCFYLSGTHQFIKSETCFFPFTLAQPADTGRQPLEGNFFFCHLHPAKHAFVLRKHIYDQFVSNGNICRIATQCCPAERTFPLAKQRADISRHKTRKIEVPVWPEV